MNTERFIAKRLMGKGNAYRIAKPIIKIAVASTAISVAVMLLSVFVVKGFQKEIRNKIVGFGGHLQLTSINQTNNGASSRAYIPDSVLASVKQLSAVFSVSAFAHQPSILESEEGLQGVLLKGVDSSYHWQFIKKHLVEGNVANHSNDIVLSKRIANSLNLKVGDRVTTFAITDNQNLKPRKLKVSGIFATGLEDVDAQLAYVDLGLIQNINKWGLKTTLLYDSLKNQLSVNAFGGEPPYTYNWSDKNINGQATTISPTENICATTRDNAYTISDTAFFNAKTKTVTQGKGTNQLYVGGYEILLNDYSKLNPAEETIYNLIPYDIQTKSILRVYPEIFSWLNMLDANVALIIIIMIIVAVINLSSTLLILILEKTNTIGLLKAMGATGKSVRNIFLHQAGLILLRGMVFGNLIAFALGALQRYFQFLKLNPESYFLENVPIDFNLAGIISINLGTFILSIVMMLLPVHLVSRITPVKVIKFD